MAMQRRFRARMNRDILAETSNTLLRRKRRMQANPLDGKRAQPRGFGKVSDIRRLRNSASIYRSCERHLGSNDKRLPTSLQAWDIAHVGRIAYGYTKDVRRK